MKYTSRPLVHVNQPLVVISIGSKFDFSDDNLLNFKKQLQNLFNKKKPCLEDINRFYFDFILDMTRCKTCVCFIFGSIYESTKEYKRVVYFEEKITKIFSENMVKMGEKPYFLLFN